MLPGEPWTIRSREDERRAGRAERRRDAAVCDEARNRFPIDHPERIARARHVVEGRQRLVPMGARDEIERPVIVAHLVEQDVQVERLRCRHAVVPVGGWRSRSATARHRPRTRLLR